MATKKQEVTVSEPKVVNKNSTLKAFLASKMPAMFDRTPDITGNLDAFVEEIIKILK